MCMCVWAVIDPFSGAGREFERHSKQMGVRGEVRDGEGHDRVIFLSPSPGAMQS